MRVGKNIFKRRVVGIDLGSNSLKAVEVETGGKVPRLVNAVVEKDVFGDASPAGRLDAGLLSGILKRRGIKTKRTVSVLPNEDLIEKYLRFPVETRKKIGDFVNWEASKHISYPVEEAAFDYSIEKPNGGSEMDVHLAVTRRSTVEEYVNLLNNSGLVAEAVEPRSIALGRILCNGPSSENTIIPMLDIGFRWTTLVILKGGRLRFSRTIEGGGKDVRDSITALMNISPAEAEDHMVNTGFSIDLIRGEDVSPTSTEYNVHSAMERAVDRLISDYRRSYEYYRVQFEEQDEPVVLYLTGGSAQMPGFDSFMEMKLKARTEVFDPFKYSGIENGSYVGPRSPLSTALGLALRFC